jgi:hypothetical protein
MDDIGIYRHSGGWEIAEPMLMRIAQKHHHSIDYLCLLVAKRVAIGESIAKEAWSEVCEQIIRNGVAFGSSHEMAWMLWLAIVGELELREAVIDDLAKLRDPHILAMLAAAWESGKLSRKPKLNLGAKLETMDSFWISSLTARTVEFSKASFSGNYSEYFTKLVDNKIRLVDFDHFKRENAVKRKKVISRTRYGYDSSIDLDDEPDF